MNDFFFISSPLHLLMAANIAIQHPKHQQTAIIISKNRQSGARLRVTLERGPALFSNVVDLSAACLLRRSRSQMSRFQHLRKIFCEPMEARLFTGNDRRMEFQYAMHLVSAKNPRTKGIYLDEGAVTYIGHKSMHRLQHRWIDPFFKKLFYGRCYKPAVTTGSSAWISRIYAAFPDAVHPLLKQKEIVAIDPAPFRTETFKKLALSMLKDNREIEETLRGIKMVLTLPHEASYLKDLRRYRKMAKQLGRYMNPSQIAVKPHPRITNKMVLHELFPGMSLLEHRIGMEALLPLLDADCIVAGDISSTLLTARWLRPELNVVAITHKKALSAEMMHLYQDVLNIPVLAPDEVKTFFDQIHNRFF